MIAAPDNPAGRAARDEARAAWQRGDATGAEAGCRRALRLGLDDAATWALLGRVLRDRDPIAAESALTRAMERDPRNPDVSFQLGNLHRQQRRYAAAIEAYERTLALAPAHIAVLNNLALALDAGGDSCRAKEIWREALRREPNHRQALGNLAHLLCRDGDYREAAALCETCLRHFHDPDARLWVDYGICQHYLRQYENAEASFRRALALVPDDALTLTNLASVLIDGNDHEGAEPILARAVALAPELPYPAALLANCRQHLCQWDGLDALHAGILRTVETAGNGDWLVNPFTALSMPMLPAIQRKIAQRWANSFPPPPRPAVASSQSFAEPGAKLRLGYVSSDFRSHAVAFLLAEVWERHDRSRFVTHAYSIGPHDASPLRTRIEAAFDRFVECSGDSPDETAQRIRDDHIDVLIDLNGYTTHARSEILALRPAPVQVSWLGYLGTMGADFIDCIITDRIVTPADQQDFFSERLVWLPHCYCPSDTRREIAPQAPSRGAYGLPPDGFVFCCFNNPYKILPALYDVWMRLLAQVGGSVLWLSPANATAAGNLRREAARRGIDPARLAFAPRVGPPEHLARHAHADLFLDTTPYNAGTTANDALFMGLPVVTCLGSTMAGRVAASQLHAIGLAELVSTDVGAYEAIALRLARNPGEMAALRARLAQNRHTHPLFDMAEFTRDLEEALLRIAPGSAGRVAPA
jgi:predicted O-linked N-acetylglucosamine transferase (SPINDLY family)